MPFHLKMKVILAPSSVGISELKANPSAVLKSAEGMPVAIPNRNRPVAYILAATAWESICDRLDNLELRQIAEARLKDGKKPIDISVDEL